MISSRTSNNEVIGYLRTGSETIFNSVYKLYYSKLYAFALSYVRSEVESEEIVQDTMVWLWENRLTLIPELQLKSLLFTIVKNKCLNSISHARMKDRVHDTLKDYIIENIEDPDFYFAKELEKLHDKALENLPEEFRNAYKMNRVECMNYDEIAKRMGVSKQTVAYRISQALKKLRVALKDYLPT